MAQRTLFGNGEEGTKDELQRFEGAENLPPLGRARTYEEFEEYEECKEHEAYEKCKKYEEEEKQENEEYKEHDMKSMKRRYIEMMHRCGLQGLGVLGVFALFLPGSAAWALEGPKVVVTYSLEGDDGGDFIQNITGTPLGLGDVRFVIDIDDDESDNAVVLTDSPQFVVIEYTADEVTEEIVSGPVELSDSYMEQEFEVLALGGAATTHTDQVLSLAREGVGTFGTGTGLITFDNETPYQQSNVGMTTCSGSTTVCNLAAPPGGWPRIEDGTPKDIPLPLFTVEQNMVLGDEIWSDNDTPTNELDDIKVNEDSQATVYSTWHGVEISRVYVPEPGWLLLLTGGSLGLAGLGRLRQWAQA